LWAVAVSIVGREGLVLPQKMAQPRNKRDLL
jgi:hypothetical protein